MSNCRSIHLHRNVAYPCVRDHDPGSDVQRYHASADGQTWWVGHERVDWVRTYHDPYADRPSYMR